MDGCDDAAALGWRKAGRFSLQLCGAGRVDHAAVPGDLHELLPSRDGAAGGGKRRVPGDPVWRALADRLCPVVRGRPRAGRRAASGG